MKRLAWSGFIAFWTATITLLVVGILAPERKAVTTEHSGSEPEGPRVITAAELAEHATEDDCWMAIRGNVYDVTEYIPLHPTPAEVMVEWCGKEATEAYETKGYGSPHSDSADEMLEEYLVGPYEGGN